MFAAKPHHIIAIGASAGGMEEINDFFDHTPADGVSYIIVQHLSADFKSRMVELLARHSKLEVNEAKNAMPVICNQVYLTPHNKFMTIRDNHLYLTDKETEPAPHLTINTFFNSLAADAGSKAIGVILSGMGTDGTEGIRAIKKAGGMVIVRNPETTLYASMPSHALGTGLVDFVLEPSLMPDAIEDYIRYGDQLPDDREDEKNISAIVGLIKEKSPFDFTAYKQTTILRRTKRRAAHHNFTSLVGYHDFLKTTPEEIEMLSREFLISVTSFFRDPEAFEFIQENVLPPLFEALAPGEELKMWVAGCATGEEVYSLAILAAEQLTGKSKDTVVKIFATDIDSLALAQAAKGIYPADISKNISPERLERFFLKEGNNYRVKPVIRKMVIFAQHDLVKNPPYCNMHFISCRNLLIYMTPILQKKIFSMLLFGLKMEGYLFLGSSENPMSIIKNLEVVHKKWKIYRNMETKQMVQFDAFLMPETLNVKHTPSFFSREDASKTSNQALAEAVNTTLAQQLDCLVICVDINNRVLKSYGETAKYLLPQNFNTNLAELLPKPLAVAFNTLSTAAIKNNESHHTSGIQISNGAFTGKVSLSVTPLATKKGAEKWFMVTFREDKAGIISHQEASIFDERTYLDQYTLNIEAELKELREELYSAYEQLDASNENMQSFNEELLSANEEMQSTNEEMQSVNEELDTINSNYQLKNKELLEINDDLNNYFRSNVNGQLFVNNELLLMKFSPGTVKQINLLETDIGRPISNISTNIKLETIIDDVKQVLTEGTVITKEIETNNGKWYQIMTMPYIQADNSSNGAVITFNDITELKKTQLELDNKNNSLLRINADLDNFVHTASHDLLAPLGNIEFSIALMNEIDIADPELNRFLSIINQSIQKFRTLITDISTIAKMESHMNTLEVVDVEEIIHNIEWSLEHKIKSARAVIHKDLEVQQILFSKKNLRSILYNLVANAIKFKRDESPVIHIHSTQQGEHVILSVQDNGIGIAKNDLHKVFDMYGRLEHGIEGQGIGLYLAKKIVDAAHGEIFVESILGQGSKFIIHIPVEPQGE